MFVAGRKRGGRPKQRGLRWTYQVLYEIQFATTQGIILERWSNGKAFGKMRDTSRISDGEGGRPLLVLNGARTFVNQSDPKARRLAAIQTNISGDRDRLPGCEREAEPPTIRVVHAAAPAEINADAIRAVHRRILLGQEIVAFIIDET